MRLLDALASTNVRKLSLFLVAGGIVYAIGGWAALAKMWQIVWSSGGTS